MLNWASLLLFAPILTANIAALVCIQQVHEDYGRALWFEKYAEEELIPAIVKVFFNRVVTKMIGSTPDEDAIKEGLAVDQPKVFAYINEQIGDKEFLVGDQFSIADISTFSPYINQKMAGEDVDASLYPNLYRYLQQLKTRPSVQRAIEMAGVEC